MNKLIKIILLSIFVVAVFNIDCVCAKAVKPPEVVELEAKDLFKLTGTITLPKDASAKKKAPLVVFAHSLGQSSTAWGNLPALINNMGFATFQLDLRGHAGSIYDKNDRKRYWRNFTTKEFLKYPRDIHDSINYIKENYPEINTNKVILIGADIGANASIIAAGKYNKDVQMLILFSPTMKYKGLETPIFLVNYGVHPILFIASSKDKYCYNSSTELLKYGQGKKVLKTLPNGGTGMNLLKTNPQTIPLILNWIKENFK